MTTEEVEAIRREIADRLSVHGDGATGEAMARARSALLSLSTRVVELEAEVLALRAQLPKVEEPKEAA